MPPSSDAWLTAAAVKGKRGSAKKSCKLVGRQALRIVPERQRVVRGAVFAQQLGRARLGIDAHFPAAAADALRAHHARAQLLVERDADLRAAPEAAATMDSVKGRLELEMDIVLP